MSSRWFRIFALRRGVKLMGISMHNEYKVMGMTMRNEYKVVNSNMYETR
jgi:hypothetical protein